MKGLSIRSLDEIAAHLTGRVLTLSHHDGKRLPRTEAYQSAAAEHVDLWRGYLETLKEKKSRVHRLCRTALSLCVGGLLQPAGAQTLDLGDLQLVVPSGLASPLWVGCAPDEPSSTLYVLEKGGRIRVIRSGTLQTSAVLDLSTLVDIRSERGLLGIAFHPDYQSNRQFYVFYSELSGRNIVARYSMNTVAIGQDITADPASAQTVLRLSQTTLTDNGGNMVFGQDGLLYIGTGGAGDNTNNSLNPASLLGKLLRITVDRDDFPLDALKNYGIPAGNPTAWPTGSGGTQSGLPELWAIGLRNPWRWSFDRITGDLWLSDVGLTNWEEVNAMSGNGGPGQNYGWPRFEGRLMTTTNIGNFSAEGSVNPIYVYPHTTQPGFPAGTTGFAITGGFMYRGGAIPGWRGRYFFADYAAGRIWSIRNINGVATDFQDHSNQLAPSGGLANLTSFGQDNDGELYIVQFSNPPIRKIVPSPLNATLSPADIVQGGGIPGPDGTVDGSDFIGFLNAFAIGDLLADIADGGGNVPADGIVDGSDFIAFINAYAVGA